MLILSWFGLFLPVQDDNSPDSEIRIQLVSVPAHGSLLRASGSAHGELAEVHQFTMEDINDRRIRYQRAVPLQAVPVESSLGFPLLYSVSTKDQRFLFPLFWLLHPLR